MNVKIQLVHKNAKVPYRKTEGAAGYDLYLPETVMIRPGRQIVPLGFKIEMPLCLQGVVKPRSGFTAKGMEGYEVGIMNGDADPAVLLQDFIKANVPLRRFDIDVMEGTVDSDYRGVVGALVKSYEELNVLVPAGTRIAQMIFEKVELPEMIEVDEITETERGTGGFGHTGAK